MPRADGVFGEQDGPLARIPDGQRPIPDEFGKAVGVPLFVRRRDNGNIRRGDGQRITQLTDEVGTIVQATVPSDDSARRGNAWLLLLTRFLGGVEGAIKNLYAALGIRLI